MSNEIKIYGLQEIQSLAKVFFDSGLFTDTKSQAQAVVKIMAGQELGIPPMRSMQVINIIKNKSALSSNGMASLIKESGKYRYKILTDPDSKTVCEIEWYERVDNKWEKQGNSKYTIENAMEADLLMNDKDGKVKKVYNNYDKKWEDRKPGSWEKNTSDMLFARALSQGVRRYAPDLGIAYTIEEMKDLLPNNMQEVEIIGMSETTKVHIDNDKNDDSMDWIEPTNEKQQEKEIPINDKKDEIKPTTSEKKTIVDYPCISEKQVKYLWVECKNNNVPEDKLKAYLLSEYKIDSTKLIPKDSFENILNWVKVI